MPLRRKAATILGARRTDVENGATEQPSAPMFSIIIPVRRPNADLRACLAACAQLEGAGYEVIVVPDEPWSDDVPSGIHVVASGVAGPGAKRDLVAAQARGEILALLDDDT